MTDDTRPPSEDAGEDARAPGRAKRRSPDGVTGVVAVSTGQPHPDLVAGCEAKPGREPYNIKKYGGFDNPLIELAYGGPAVTVNSVAAKWDLYPPTLERAFKKRKLDKIREQRLAAIDLEQSSVYDSATLQRLREEHVTARVALADEEIAALRAERVKMEIETVNPMTGKKHTRRWNMADWQKYVATLRELIEIKSVALGVPTKTTGAMAGATVNMNRIEQINIIDQPGVPEDAIDAEILALPIPM